MCVLVHPIPTPSSHVLPLSHFPGGDLVLHESEDPGLDKGRRLQAGGGASGSIKQQYSNKQEQRAELPVERAASAGAASGGDNTSSRG